MERKKTRTVVHVTRKENGATGDKAGVGTKGGRGTLGGQKRECGDEQKQSLYENSMTPI